ncbi:hypothetical protein Emag_007092 [Eimeria magna]
MEFQGSSPPTSPLRRKLNLGSPEGETNDRRSTYDNLEAELTPGVRIVNSGMAIRLEPFDGTDFRWWISTADAYYDERDYNDEQRLRNVRYYLKGDAGAYWLGLQEEAPEWRPNAWEEFKEMMRKRFDTRDPIFLIHELRNVQYRGITDKTGEEELKEIGHGNQMTQGDRLAVTNSHLVASGTAEGNLLTTEGCRQTPRAMCVVAEGTGSASALQLTQGKERKGTPARGVEGKDIGPQFVRHPLCVNYLLLHVSEERLKPSLNSKRDRETGGSEILPGRGPQA